jgi:GrpB-like predicted nucleotidyltransferase (UPF0157 family)
MPIDESITICEYNPTWSHFFELEKVVILSVIKSQVVDIEHFGSTAVPGLAAKPIVDILIGLKSYPTPDETVDALKSIGYEYFGEAGVPERLYFRKRYPLAFNLAAVKWGSQLWRDNLLLREYLRSQPEARRRYEQHKRAIIAAGHSQLLAYSVQKAQVISNLLERAREWANGLEL